MTNETDFTNQMHDCLCLSRFLLRTFCIEFMLYQIKKIFENQKHDWLDKRSKFYKQKAWLILSFTFSLKKNHFVRIYALTITKTFTNKKHDWYSYFHFSFKKLFTRISLAIKVDVGKPFGCLVMKLNIFL